MSEFTAAHHAAIAQLTGPGAPFEVIEATRDGYAVKSYRNAEPNLCAVMAPGRQFGDALFIEYLDQAWTFAQFFGAVDALAGYLKQACSIAAGDRVAIAMRNRPEWLIAFVAIMECGGVAVPLNSWGKAAELQQGLEDSAAQVVICDEARFGFIRDKLGKRIRADSGVGIKPISITGSKRLVRGRAWYRPSSLRCSWRSSTSSSIRSLR